MSENIKVRNDNKYNIGLKCNAWHKHRRVKPMSFIHLTEDEVLELDSDYSFFSSGELICENEALNVRMGYVELNPNTITEAHIEEVLKLTPVKIKEKLSGITENFALNRIYDVAKRTDLSVSKLKAVEEVLGRKIEIEEIKAATEEVEVKKTTKTK